MLCDCSVTAVGSERLPFPSINNALAPLVFHISSLFFTTSFFSPLSASTMGKGTKRKREPTPPSDDFGDSEYSEEEFSSESEGSPAPVSPPASSDDSDDSQGIAAEVWTYIRAVERSGLEGSDESEFSSVEEDSDGGEDEDDDDDDGNSDDGGDGDGDGSNGGGGDKGSTRGGSSTGSTRGGGSKGGTKGGGGGSSSKASG
jgi:hypothetical protein